MKAFLILLFTNYEKGQQGYKNKKGN